MIGFAGTSSVGGGLIGPVGVAYDIRLGHSCAPRFRGGSRDVCLVRRAVQLPLRGACFGTR
eukprot:34313-Eustigmatos_ZCMA.PRE.1